MQDFSEKIENALDVMIKFSEKTSSKKNLFDKGRTVYLQVVLFQIPIGPPRKRKFLKLCHSLYGDDPEICLFVPNRKTNVEYKKTTDELIDFCVDYYTELLERHKVKGVTAVMPLKQLRSEYGTYELKRKLVRRFDLFLCKNSLLYNHRFLSCLGKVFEVANKLPLGVSFPKNDVDFDPEFQKNIKRAIFTSSFYISRFSDNYSIPIGSLSNTKEELKENLESVLNQLFTEKIIPGGLKNVRAMNLWPSQSKPVPLYVSPELPTNIKKPIVRTKRKRPQGVGDELSTQPGKKVYVMANGDVFVTKMRSKKDENLEINISEDEDFFEDGSDEDDENDENKKINKESEAERMIGNKEESESEDDEEIEKKEAKLLKVKREAELNSFTELTGEEEEEEEGEGEEENEKEEKAKVKKKQKIKRSQSGAKKGCERKSNERKNLKTEKVNKTKRKMLIKQKKFKVNEKLIQTNKSKQKKTKEK